MGLSLLDFDMFGTTLGFRSNNHFYKKSCLGLCLTFSFFLVVLFLVIYFGIRYFKLDAVVENVMNYRYQDSQNITINDSFVFEFKSNLDILYGLSDNNNTYFYSTFEYIKVENSKEIGRVHVKKRNCKELDWTLYDVDHNIYNALNGICYNANNLLLQGNSQSANYSYFEAKFYLNYTKDEKHNQHIERILQQQDIMITYHMVDTVYRYNTQFQGPKRFLRFRQLPMLKQETSIENLYISVNDIQILHENFFGNTYDHQYFFSLNSYDYLVSSFNPEDPYLISFRLYSSEITKVDIFSPKTLTQYISELSGIVNLIMMIFMGISSYFNNHSLNYSLLKKQLDIVNNNPIEGFFNLEENIEKGSKEAEEGKEVKQTKNNYVSIKEWLNNSSFKSPGKQISFQAESPPIQMKSENINMHQLLKLEENAKGMEEETPVRKESQNKTPERINLNIERPENENIQNVAFKKMNNKIIVLRNDECMRKSKDEFGQFNLNNTNNCNNNSNDLINKINRNNKNEKKEIINIINDLNKNLPKELQQNAINIKPINNSPKKLGISEEIQSK